MEFTAGFWTLALALMDVMRHVFMALYLTVLVLIALYGFHRWMLVFLYYRHRKKIPKLKGRFEQLPRVTVQLPMYNELYVAKRIIEASADAEAIAIKAEAQAEAYRVIAEQIGRGNAALVELLQIIGEQGINITPRVMVVGGGASEAGSVQDAETTALIGTMLDAMMRGNLDEQESPER